MKYVINRILSLCLLLSCGYGYGREILTTLPLYYAPYHFPLNPYQDDKDWYVNLRGSAYYRSADDAFSNCDSTCKVPFTTLIFGKSDFTLADAFTDSSVDNALPLNPFVTISTLTPRFDYNEKGAMFEMTGGAKFGCEKKWHAGARARLPIREIDVQEVCGNEGNDLIGVTLSDVYRQRQESIKIASGPDAGAENTNLVWAARLDFLSHILQIALNNDGTPEPMVFYNNPAENGGRITIAGENVSDNILAAATPPFLTNTPMVAVIDSANGSIPESVRWGDVNSNITGVVAPDGSGLSNLQRGRFAGDVAYYTPLSTNVPAQSKLFVVPTINDTNNTGGYTAALQTPGATTIQSQINAAIENLDTSVEAFIQESGLDFCDGRSKGLGDLDLELYAGYDWDFCHPLYTDLILGFRFPTGDKVCDCKQVLKQPTGNGGHYEVRTGFQGGVDVTRWFKVRGDFFYAWVLNGTESIPATFQGATIKNIGPCVPAKIHWGYLFANLDATFFANDCCGFNIGYQVYHKGCDHVQFCQATATDLAGRPNQPLDASVAQMLTNRTQHKILAEFFLSTSSCEFFTGYDYAVAGKNAPVDSDFYLGIKVAF